MDSCAREQTTALKVQYYRTPPLHRWRIYKIWLPYPGGMELYRRTQKGELLIISHYSANDLCPLALLFHL